VVLEVLADTRQVVDDLDAEGAELVGRPDTRQEQELRRVDGAAAEDDLAVGVRDVRAIVVQIGGSSSTPRRGRGIPAWRASPASTAARPAAT